MDDTANKAADDARLPLGPAPSTAPGSAGDALLTVDEITQQLNITHVAVRALMMGGDLPAVGPGYEMARTADVEAFLAKRGRAIDFEGFEYDDIENEVLSGRDPDQR